MSHEIQLAADAINNAFDQAKPEVAIVLGSGLGELINRLTGLDSIAYSQIPGFSQPGVKGHRGMLFFGTVGNKNVLIMQGRTHCYESGDPATMSIPIRAIAKLGCRQLILTCAAGSVNRRIEPGSLALIQDHINLTGLSPLTGVSGDSRFLDLTDLYSLEMRTQLSRVAKKRKIQLSQGVYMWFPGPNFETPAEIRAAATLGADLVGMSIVPEAIVALHAGMRLAATAVVTNYAAGISPLRLSHRQTLETASKSEHLLADLLESYLSIA